MNYTNQIDKIFNKDKKTISRIITAIEEESTSSIEIINSIHKKTGNAYRIGITGPPGAGKSTLTNQLTKLYRGQNKSVAVIAVDPTSPFTGGALLGDRIRMNEISNDPDVFIRSMATRGSLGGLSKKAVDAADVLDAAEFDIIIFETVGVGQSELDIARAADTTIVVLVPESGDSIQAMKAGLMEIADIFVLNKSDRPGADSALTSIKTILQFKHHDEHSWMPEIIRAIASENTGINIIADEVNRHREYLVANSLLILRREKNLKIRIKEIVEKILRNEFWNESRENKLGRLISEVVTGEISPYILADELVKHYKNDF
ncbi:MAG: methylmalonyl Co-A mutase-associated GTPase MeaB [bacterium]